MANRIRGDERRGQDDDGDVVPGQEQKVEIENTYFEKLKERLAQQGGGGSTGPFAPTAEDEKRVPAPAGPVVYNDDGSVYKRST